MKKISNEDKQNIQNAIADIESRTAAEVVPVILSASDAYPVAFFRVGVVCAFLAGFISYFVFPHYDALVYLLVQIPFFFAGVLLAEIPAIRRTFLFRSEMATETFQRAVEIFHRKGLHTCKDRNGILLIISLMERQAHLLADSGIDEKVAPGTWDVIIKNLVENIRSGRMTKGYKEALLACGLVLEEHFPHQSGDVNELSNVLITDL